MPNNFRILFLGEPKSPNTISWVEGLRKLGCEVRIASVRCASDDDALPIGPRLLPPRARFIFGVEYLNKIIDEVKPDIIIAYRVTSYGYLAACTGFKPLVLAAQNEQITYVPNRAIFRRWILGYFARFAIKKAQFIHAWCENIRQGLLKYGARDEQIFLMHRGINLEVFKRLETLKSFSKESPVFISTRSLEKEYLIDVLLKSYFYLLKEIPKARLVIVGNGSQKENLINIARDLNIEKNVVFKGRLKENQVADEIRNSDFYISLIQTEGMSSSLLEACACGIMPIVADIPASREIIEDGKNGFLIKDFNPEKIAEKMREAVLDDKLRIKTFEDSKRIEQNFDRRENLKIFVEHYKNILGRRPSENSKIHICHITTSHSPDDTRIFYRECCSLVKKGYKVTLIARVRKKILPYEQEGVHIIPIRYILGRPGRKFILPKIAAKLALKLKADIYHFHDPELMPWMCLMAKNHAVKVVFDVHELYSATIKEFYIKRFSPISMLLAHYYTRLEKMWCGSFAGIVAVSEPIRRKYSEMGFNAVTVRNVVDLSRIPVTKTVEKNRNFSIIASGTTNNSRCIMELLDAFSMVVKKHPETQLYLICLFDSVKDEEKIRVYIGKKGLQKNVKIHPLVSWERLISTEIPVNHLGMVLYAKTDNNYAGLPNRLFEYWACKLPVVATDTPLLKEIISECGGGKIVDSEKPEEIADAICYYIENQEMARHDGEKGYESVLSQHNWELELNKLCEFYEQILQKSQSNTVKTFR